MFVCVRVRVLHVQYSHAEAGTFGSHKWQVPETNVSFKSHEMHCHHQYQEKDVRLHHHFYHPQSQ